MTNMLIGSSNVARFYLPNVFKNYRKYEMTKCTRIADFRARVGCLEPSTKRVVISVVENFFVEMVGETPDPAEFSDKLTDTINQYIITISEAAIRLPDTKFALVKPILRPKHKWYMENHDEICEDIEKGIKRLGRDNVTMIDAISRASQIFTRDETHLTEDAGHIFVEGILSGAEAFFGAEIIELDSRGKEEGHVRMDTEKEELMMTTEKAVPSKILLKDHAIINSSKVLEKLGGVEKKVDNLERKMKKDRWFDCLMSAKLREEMDAIGNGKKEDRIIITGLTSTTPTPVSAEEKTKWLGDIVKDLMMKILPEASQKIIFINQGKSRGRDIPMVDVKFDKRETANAVRRAFVEKMKKGEHFGKLHIANNVTLATRVRVEIMKAIAKQFSVKGEEEMYVVAYSSRPVLQHRTEGAIRPFTLTFADAVAKYGKRLNPEVLDDSYRRAGRSFKGLLQQNFVVLNDETEPITPVAGSGIEKSQRKRPLEDQTVIFERESEGDGRGGARGRGYGGRGGRGAKSARK